MQSEYRSQHVINSVSDLYISDEISVLLEEIRSLEPLSLRPEEIQDFEIAGSQTGNTGGGGRTASSVAELETPGDIATIHSWDSHANYKQHGSPSHSAFSGIVLHYDKSHMKTSSGLIRLLLVTTSLLCLLCLCTSGIFRYNLFLLPLLGRIRFMLFASLFGLLITSTFLFIDVTHVIYLFPFNWGKINAILYVIISVLFFMSSSLIVHQVYTYADSYSWVPRSTRSQLIITAGLGYISALEALLLALLTRYDEGQYRPVSEDAGTFTLQERSNVVRYSPSPCPSLQPAVVTPHWIPQEQNMFPSVSSSKTVC